MSRFDRDTALKNAEKALRQGRIDAAIVEYVRIVEALPRDWNSANALGDLYVRAKQVDKGVAQYTRIADHLASEGFYPKAVALYKKIVKVAPADEYAWLQTGEIASKQGLLADAKNAFRTAADVRRKRGDTKGAAEIGIRIGTLDPEDFDARLGAARDAAEIGDTQTARREFREVGLGLERLGRTADSLQAFQHAYDLDPADNEVRRRLLLGYLQAADLPRARLVATTPADLKHIAAALESAGRQDEMLEVLAEISRLDPADLEVRASLAQAYVAKGDLERARQFLNRQTAGQSAPLWLTLAEIELAAGRLDEGHVAVSRTLSLDPSQRDAALALGCRLAETSAAAGYPCVAAVTDAALAERHYGDAAAALQQFVSRVEHHLVALMRLVEVCVDGGLAEDMYRAQAQLADAYLAAGRGLEARIISEDLLGRTPDPTAIARFRRALEMLGEDDPDAIVAERLQGDNPFLGTETLDLNEGIFFEDGPVEDTEASIPTAVAVTAIAPEALADSSVAAAPSARSLTQVFRDLRDEVEQDPGVEVAAEQLTLATTYLELGMTDDAIEALKVAAGCPRQRFEAASLLGRIFSERDDRVAAIEWLERAAQVPGPSPDASRGLLYELAETLERQGEDARALAVFVELQAEGPGFRDVSHRIASLSHAHTRG